MDSYGLLAILMLALGLALLVAEVFIPSGGVIAAAATLTFLISIWAAWHAWFRTEQTSIFITYCAVLIILFPSVLSGAFYVLPRTEYGKRLMNPPSLDELQPFVAETARLKQLIGTVGTTTTKMVPGGIVQIAGERFHAESEGMLLPAGISVKVLSLRGNRLLVREAHSAEVASDKQSTSNRRVDSEPTPLDDEFAQS